MHVVSFPHQKKSQEGGNVMKASNFAMNAYLYAYELTSLLLEEHRVICRAEKYEAGIAGCAGSCVGEI